MCDIECKPLACLSTFIPVVNTFLAIYLWYKQIVKTDSSLRQAIKNLVTSLKNI